MWHLKVRFTILKGVDIKQALAFRLKKAISSLRWLSSKQPTPPTSPLFKWVIEFLRFVRSGGLSVELKLKIYIDYQMIVPSIRKDYPPFIPVA